MVVPFIFEEFCSTVFPPLPEPLALCVLHAQMLTAELPLLLRGGRKQPGHEIMEQVDHIHGRIE